MFIAIKVGLCVRSFHGNRSRGGLLSRNLCLVQGTDHGNSVLVEGSCYWGSEGADYASVYA